MARYLLDRFICESKLADQSVYIKPDIPPVSMKHDIETVIRKQKEDQKQESLLGDENQFQTQQELIQSLNEGCSQFVFERTLRRKHTGQG